jgi:RimJ/RimL family protein N-acetyltransferase
VVWVNRREEEQTIELRALDLSDMELIRQWRNGCLETLRTPYPLTREMQESFYKDVCNRPDARYWALVENGKTIGMGGLTSIQWENRIAEISLILAPGERYKNIGSSAADLILNEGFRSMGLKTVYGECYYCNAAGINFWKKYIEADGRSRSEIYSTKLPNRKFRNGLFYDSLYFSIDAP